MISDLHLADFALAAYTAPATVETADAHALVSDMDGMQIVALRGTDPKSLVDLWRDAVAAGVRHDPIFGPVSASFFTDAEQLVWRLWPLLREPYAITGHSKGATEGQALAAIFAHMGRPPALVTVFEPPQLGTLNGALRTIDGRAYRHGDDPITELPPARGHAQPLTALAWSGQRPREPLAYHSMAGVRDALAGKP